MFARTFRSAIASTASVSSGLVRFQRPGSTIFQVDKPPHQVWRQRSGDWNAEQSVRKGLEFAVSGTDSLEERLRRTEAVLLLCREPLPNRKLAQLADLADATEARTLVRQLNENYDQTGRAFRAEEVAGGWMLLTRPQFAPWLRRLGHVPGEERLSQPLMETLAIVAYRQPVLRADIESIRGVGCGEVLRQLMQRDLIRMCGRSEDLGRPYLYGTTKRFLQMFGLRTADRLPRAEWVREAGTVGNLPIDSDPVDNAPPDEPEYDLPNEDLLPFESTASPEEG